MSSSTRPCLALLVLAAISVAGFEIVKNEPATSYVKEDGVLTLLCESDTYWEWCTFKAPAGKICDYVWTKEDRGNGRWNISVEACDDFAGRQIEFQGDYDSYQCGIKLTGVQPEDAGEWTCEMESYHAGYTRKYGYIREKAMTVKSRSNHLR